MKIVSASNQTPGLDLHKHQYYLCALHPLRIRLRLPSIPVPEYIPYDQRLATALQKM